MSVSHDIIMIEHSLLNRFRLMLRMRGVKTSDGHAQ